MHPAVLSMDLILDGLASPPTIGPVHHSRSTSCFSKIWIMLKIHALPRNYRSVLWGSGGGG